MSMEQETSREPSRTVALWLYLLAALSVVAGFYFRFKGLGFSPFAIDEYYLATSVDNIVQHGVPALKGGGYYTRGIALQYLAAPLFMAGLDHEWALRLLTVLFNIAAIPAVFLLARHVAGTTAACIAVMMYSLAVWEVEFARFARMYATFGSLFLWHLYFLYRRVVLDDAASQKWLWLLSVAAIFLSEFAVFLALLNFVPALLSRGRLSPALVAVPLAVLALTYAWWTQDFRNSGISDNDQTPAAVVEVSSSTGDEAVAGRRGHLPVHPPPVLLMQAKMSQAWLVGLVVPALLFFLAAFMWLKANATQVPVASTNLGRAVPIIVLALAFLNLFGLAFWTTIIAIWLLPIPRQDIVALRHTGLTLISAASFLASLAFWATYVLTNDGWQDLLPIQTGERLKEAVLLLFNYPNVWREIVAPFRNAMPLQSAMMGVAIVAGAWVASSAPRHGRSHRGYLLVAGLALVAVLLVAIFTKPYYTLRYLYFVYPVGLLLAAVAIVLVNDRLLRGTRAGVAAAVLMAGGFMVAAEDFDARHLLHIDSERATFRIGYSAGLVDAYYRRWDYRSPAQFVNARRSPEDIVISGEYSVPYYLDQLDYLYLDRQDRRLSIVSRDGGKYDLWEGVPLLISEEQVLHILRDATSAVWLIARSEKYGFQNPAERHATVELTRFRVYRSVDGHLDVYRIPPGFAFTQP